MNGKSLSFVGRVNAALAKADADSFGAQIHHLPIVTSTNDVARGLAAEGAPEGTLVVADWQSAGRGRAGRSWEAPPSGALLVSILFRPTLPPEQSGRLTMVCGLSTAEAIEKVTGAAVSGKWPNDLLMEGKKVAGILVECTFLGSEIAWAIAGVGVNVNFRFAEDSPLWQTASTLFSVTGRVCDRAELLAVMLMRIKYWAERITSSTLLEAWRERCETLGQRMCMETPDGVIEGLAETIDENGALWVRLDSGARKLVTIAP